MKIYFYYIIIILFIACQSKNHSEKLSDNQLNLIKDNKLEVAIFAGGCFWCTEAIFLELEGVHSVKPGYIGGKTVNPTYEEVCSGDTGHAEAIQILFDPKVISFSELLEVFFATHDPTTLNQQGADRGTQYRSEIFYTNENQKITTKKHIDFLNSENNFLKKIVTQISPESIFYTAEDYHQNYYNQNKNKSYCSYVITPKVEIVKKEFKSKLKK